MKDEIVKEWFERGSRDFETAKLIFSQRGFNDEIMFLLQQAVEKYLKGFLIYAGWELRKIHDVETLLTEAMEFDQSFAQFLDFGRKLSAYYYEGRYPPGPIPEISTAEIKSSINIADKIITEVSKKVNLR